MGISVGTYPTCPPLLSDSARTTSIKSTPFDVVDRSKTIGWVSRHSNKQQDRSPASDLRIFYIPAIDRIEHLNRPVISVSRSGNLNSWALGRFCRVILVSDGDIMWGLYLKFFLSGWCFKKYSIIIFFNLIFI